MEQYIKDDKTNYIRGKHKTQDKTDSMGWRQD